MSDYVPVTHVNGETFNAGSANAWETRIDNAFTSHETTMSGLATTDTALDTRIDALEATQNAIPIHSAVPDTYTLVLSDAGQVLECLSNANAKTWTVPNNTSVAFPVGTVIEILNIGGGGSTITIAAASGVTVNSPGGVLAISQQWAAARLRKRGTNTWVLSGNIG